VGLTIVLYFWFSHLFCSLVFSFVLFSLGFDQTVTKQINAYSWLENSARERPEFSGTCNKSGENKKGKIKDGRNIHILLRTPFLGYMHIFGEGTVG
jgi:ATP/ADP translocase